MDKQGNQDILEYLQSIAESKTFHHAYIFAGSQQTPKSDIAKSFAQMLYCPGSTQDGMFGDTEIPCKSCLNCHQVETALHPDLKIISPEEGKHAISIKQVKELQTHLVQSPSVAPYTIGIIQQAHEMSVAASNALLKTLEEPSSSSLIILLTHAPDDLLATIRSRSQVIEFSDEVEHESVVDEEEAQLFHSLISSSRGQALELLDGLFSSKKKHKEEKDLWYQRLSVWKILLRQMIMVKLEYVSEFPTQDIHLSLTQLQQGIDSLSDLQKKLAQNVNTRLHFEAFILELLK